MAGPARVGAQLGSGVGLGLGVGLVLGNNFTDLNLDLLAVTHLDHESRVGMISRINKDDVCVIHSKRRLRFEWITHTSSLIILDIMPTLLS